jgi:hypothetical protein
MSNEDMSIKLPKGAVEGVINAHIQAAVFEALGKNPDRLIAKVVDKAMNHKANRYDRTTVFEEAIATEIRAVAREEFKKWLDENRPKIRDQIRAKLKTVKVAKLITESLAENIEVRIDVKARVD